jgi:hypothetical protein
VSSTFDDFEVERNLLQERVFPRLRELCARRNARFQAIDLRWGISQEAALDQLPVSICLREVWRCQEVTPRPNFLVLLGERYGSRPPPERLPARDFEAIRERAGDDDRRLLAAWYLRDENAVPAEYRLQARRDERAAFAGAPAWRTVAQRLGDVLAAAADDLGLGEAWRRTYLASATEQEVAVGALAVPDPRDRVFCVFRAFRPRPDAAAGGRPSSAAARYLEPTANGRARLRALKEELRRHLAASLGGDVGAAVRDETVAWEERGPRFDGAYLGGLAGWVTAALEGAIERELRRPVERPEATAVFAAPLAPLAADRELREEVREHLAFGAERSRHFVGREEALAEIAAYLDGDEPRPFCLHGNGGSGKSAVLAQAAHEARRDRPGAEVVVRFIGATPASANGRSLLERLCREIDLRFGGRVGEPPAANRGLAQALLERLATASRERPILLFLDALDQLAERDGAGGAAWLPAALPAHVRLVASTRPGEVFDRLAATGPRLCALGPMPRRAGGLLLNAWLAAARPPRRLQPLQQRAVLDGFDRSGGNPLYLRLACDQAGGWPAYPPAGERSGPAEELAGDLAGIIRRHLFAALAAESAHGEALVDRALGYLAASRDGLAEDEHLDLLSRDPEVYAAFLRRGNHLPPDLVAHARRALDEERGRRAGHPGENGAEEAAAWLDDLRRGEGDGRLRRFLGAVLPRPDGPRLPVVLWSRLAFDLRPYLVERLAEGGALTTFYHREMAEVAARAFVGEELHGRMADYFRLRADQRDDDSWIGGDIRGLSELPFHLTAAARWRELHATLTDFRFLERKASEVGVVERAGVAGGRLHTGVFRLQDDLDHALRAMPAAGRPAAARQPLIVTAVDRGAGPVVRCPWCGTVHQVPRAWLEVRDFACPGEGCGGPLRLNRFVVRGARSAAGWR